MARPTTMLGTEYNWLVESASTTTGTPKVRLASGGLFTLAVAIFCLGCVVLRATPVVSAKLPDETAWAITDMDGIIEGIAIHPTTLESFFSDVHNRCIWYRDVSGDTAVMKKFSAETDHLPGVFALKFDASGRTLWASCSALPEMRGYTATDKGRAFLAAYDMATRKLRRTYALPFDGQAHVLGDFILCADGTIYATDSTSPVIWRLRPDGDHLEKWLEQPDFKSLQGLAHSADGQSLYVADYSRGLWRIARATRSVALLPAPAGTNLRGMDGLYAVPGGLVAVQNGLNPQRVIRLTLDATGALSAANVLLSGHPSMTDLGLGQVVNDRFVFIGNSGWEFYANPAATPAPRPIIILTTPL